MKLAITLAVLALSACGPTPRATVTGGQPAAHRDGSQEHATQVLPARVSGSEPSVEGEEDEDEEARLPCRVTELSDPRTFDEGAHQLLDEDMEVQMRLGGRMLSVRFERYELDSEQSGNGMVFTIDVVAVGDGAILLAHHNLDLMVDPPRFFNSRWSEAWWFPPQLADGQDAIPVPLGGDQHVTALVHQGRVCFYDAVGQARRFQALSGSLVPDADVSPCGTHVAPQPEPVFVFDHGRWRLQGDDYLTLQRTRELHPGLYAAQVFWSDGGQYAEDESVPTYPSTRLLRVTPDGVVTWFYLDRAGHCAARFMRGEITCGSQRFVLDGDHLSLSGR